MSEPGHISAEGPQFQVSDVPERHRYEARFGADGPLAALLSYDLSETWIALLHTEVQEGFEGQGVGSRLVHWVCDDARSRGLAIIPKCPFMVRWLEHHPEQQDLLSHPLPAPEPGPSGEPPKLA